MSLKLEVKRFIDTHKTMNPATVARLYNLDYVTVNNYMQGLKRNKEKKEKATCHITGFPIDTRWR